MDLPALTFNRLLEDSGVDRKEVVVMRHRPWEPELNRMFDWIVAERRDLFESYQSTHAPNTQSALMRARFLASFVRHGRGKALFVGLYEIVERRPVLRADWYESASARELLALGMALPDASERQKTVIEFSMKDTGWCSHWSQRLVIAWPGLERSWYRWANRNIFMVEAIAEEPVLVRSMPAWQNLSLSWQELRVLPHSWRAALAQWRGVYLVIDRSDSRMYVGSAAARENLLSRWTEYAASGHGGNKHLRGRDPANFVFSILERTSPDMPSEELVALENSWKVRLRTRAPHGLNAN